MDLLSNLLPGQLAFCFLKALWTGCNTAETETNSCGEVEEMYDGATTVMTTDSKDAEGGFTILFFFFFSAFVCLFFFFFFPVKTPNTPTEKVTPDFDVYSTKASSSPLHPGILLVTGVVTRWFVRSSEDVCTSPIWQCFCDVKRECVQFKK